MRNVDRSIVVLLLGSVALAADSPPDDGWDWKLDDATAGCAGWFATGAGDLDGDGHGELIVGDPHDDRVEPSAGATHVFFGGQGGLPGMGFPIVAVLPDGVVWNEGDVEAQLMGFHVAPIGDTNGDGLDETATRDDFGNVYLGAGDDPWMISCPFGLTAASAGDVNADGLGDILVHCGRWVSIFLGSASPPPCDPCLVIDGDWLYDDGVAADGQRYAFPAGDVNGDGFDDVIFTVSGSPTRAVLFHGPLSGLASPADLDWEFDAASFLKVGYGGDLNRDGFDDVVIQQTDGFGAVHVFYGSAQSLKACSGPCTTADADWSLLGTESDIVNVGVPGIAGDFGGDGYADLVVPAQLDHDGVGSPAVGLFQGGIDGLPDCLGSCTIREADWLSLSDELETLSAANAFGGAAGDVNGDGGLDLVVGYPLAGFGGETLVFHGFADFDHDGISVEGGDCDDSDGALLPGAPELLDGSDNQCPQDLEGHDDPGAGYVDEITPSDIAWTRPPGFEEICWPSMPGAATYELVASSAPTFELPAACSEIRASSARCLDELCCVDGGFVPAPGESFYFLARATQPLPGSFGGPSGAPAGSERFPCEGNRISNGDFEVGPCPGGFETLFSGGRIPIGAAPFEYPDDPWHVQGMVELSCRNTMWRAGSGSRAVRLNAGASIRQTPAIESNRTLTVEFLFAAESAAQIAVEIDVQGSGFYEQTQSFDYVPPPGGFDGTPGQWTPATAVFQSAGPPPTLRFRAVTGPSVLLDRVEVNSGASTF